MAKMAASRHRLGSWPCIPDADVAVIDRADVGQLFRSSWLGFFVTNKS